MPLHARGLPQDVARGSHEEHVGMGPGQALELGSSAFELLEWGGHEPTS